ncbi:hypothetical protein ACJOXM_11475 [Acinetobacter baumannii]
MSDHGVIEEICSDLSKLMALPSYVMKTKNDPCLLGGEFVYRPLDIYRYWYSDVFEPALGHIEIKEMTFPTKAMVLDGYLGQKDFRENHKKFIKLFLDSQQIAYDWQISRLKNLIECIETTIKLLTDNHKSIDSFCEQKETTLKCLNMFQEKYSGTFLDGDSYNPVLSLIKKILALHVNTKISDLWYDRILFTLAYIEDLANFIQPERREIIDFNNKFYFFKPIVYEKHFDDMIYEKLKDQIKSRGFLYGNKIIYEDVLKASCKVRDLISFTAECTSLELGRFISNILVLLFKAKSFPSPYDVKDKIIR